MYIVYHTNTSCFVEPEPKSLAEPTAGEFYTTQTVQNISKILFHIVEPKSEPEPKTGMNFSI